MILLGLCSKSSIQKLYFMDNCPFEAIVGNAIVTCNMVSMIHLIWYTNTLIPDVGMHHHFTLTIRITLLVALDGYHVVSQGQFIDAGTSGISSSVQQLKVDRRFFKAMMT
jgi:hypothetical protein